MTIAHSLHCPKGGYTHLRPSEIRDCFGELLDQVCHDVEIEPKLLPFQGESFASNSVTKDDEAQLDIKANALWGVTIPPYLLRRQGLQSACQIMSKKHQGRLQVS